MSDPIPTNIYQRIKEWASERKTGAVTLLFHEGNILKAKVEETVTAK